MNELMVSLFVDSVEVINLPVWNTIGSGERLGEGGGEHADLDVELDDEVLDDSLDDGEEHEEVLCVSDVCVDELFLVGENGSE